MKAKLNLCGKSSLLGMLILTGCLAFVAPSLAIGPAVTCESLTTPDLFPDTTVTLAISVSANPVTGIPAHCRVVATVNPTPGSNIGVEYRLSDIWNGKFLGIGGGGFGGSISAGSFAEGLRRGYAAAQTNIGHTSADGDDWALTAPGVPNRDRVTDYAWRAVRLMTTVGKQIVQYYYGQNPNHSYWQGCSLGGREGMMEVQRFPEDYDGVIAGDPVYTHRLQLGSVWRANQFQAQPGTSLTAALLPVINSAVLAACDAMDGLEDGVIDDPRRCAWDPSELLCSDASESNCLTAEQADALRSVYAGTITSDGELLYEGVPRGSELNWQSRYVADASNAIGAQLGKYMVFLDPSWDSHTLDINDPATVALWDDAQVSVEGNAGDPDISAFIRRGGKMIMYHGSYDPGPSPLSTIKYYEQVEEIIGKSKDLKTGNPGNPADRVRENVRLFMVPGMYHCSGGPGANSFDALTALEQWVEQGVGPDSILATNSATGVSRPLCPYPEVARYIGSGDVNDSANFRCETGIGEGAGHGQGNK